MEKELTKEQAKALFASVDYDLDKLTASQAGQVMTALFGKKVSPYSKWLYNACLEILYS